MNKRVKIVATLGPAVEIRGGKKFGDDGYWGEKLDVEASAKNIAQLIEAGANTFRFNFSHGDHQEQGDRMATVKLAEKLAGKKVGFLLDTKGPEIRTELFEGDAKEYSYTTGEKIRVATKQGIKSTRDVIALNVAGALDIYDDVEASTSSFSPQYPSSPNFLPPRISTAGPKVATIFTRLFMIFVTPLYNSTFFGHFTSLVKVD